MNSPHIQIGAGSDHRLVETADRVVVGVFVATGAPKPNGEELTLTLSMPWGEQMEVHGHVAHVVTPEQATLRRRPGMAVRCDLADWQVQLLEKCRLQRAPMLIPG